MLKRKRVAGPLAALAAPAAGTQPPLAGAARGAYFNAL
jgi:hypothetical protein